MPKAKAAPAEKKEKKEKKPKDPNAPKKPWGAYMFFCEEMREKLKREHPEYTFKDIGRVLGEEWRECADSDKKRFYDKAEKDKERYNREMADYQQ